MINCGPKRTTRSKLQTFQRKDNETFVRQKLQRLQSQVPSLIHLTHNFRDW